MARLRYDHTVNRVLGFPWWVISLISFSLISWSPLFAQSFTTPDYFENIAVPTKLFKQKRYAEAAVAYSNAFWASNDKGAAEDRFRAACAWAMAGSADSAFAQLETLLVKARFDEHEKLVSEPLLASLHQDIRWPDVLLSAKHNFDSRQVISPEIILELEAMGQTDRKLRNQWERYEKRYGPDDARTKKVIVETVTSDSINTARLKTIVSQIGWPGFKEAGYEANVAAFLVVQHADAGSQLELLPIMRSAVVEHKVYPADLAMLEDRVNTLQCKDQVYGTQLRILPEENKPCIFRIADPENLDIRRHELGLQPMADYLKFWKLDWNPMSYSQCPCIPK